MVSCLVTPSYIAVANVGDSRAVVAVKPELAGHYREEIKENLKSELTDATDELATSLQSCNIEENTSDQGPVFVALPLSIDHKMTLADERKRAEEANGKIDEIITPEGKIYEVSSEVEPERRLRMSRSFGDFFLKMNDTLPFDRQISIPVPDVVTLSRVDDGSIGFILLACDGIWDVMSDQEAVNFVAAKLYPRLSSPDIQSIEGKQAHVAAACDDLIQKCLELGSTDNMTALIILLDDLTSSCGDSKNNLMNEIDTSLEGKKLFTD